MAQQRKLQTEMEKVFKKVVEGIEIFEETLKKMFEAASDNQKDKFQDELKREMKKLQRLRDSIKGWQQSNDVKDKEILAHYRRIIEERMEQFKDIERESKTKPHSKQGLQAAEKVDPREKEKSDTIEFLQAAIARLNVQVEQLESEVEEAQAESGRRRKAGPSTQRVDAALARHKHHIHSLELIMRLLNNDTIEAPQVIEIEEDVEDYISRNMEDGFVENEFVYEDLALEDMEKELGSVTNIGTLEEVVEVQTKSEVTTPITSPSPTPCANSQPNKAEAEEVSASSETVKSSKSRRRRRPRTPNCHTILAESVEEKDAIVLKPRTRSGTRQPPSPFLAIASKSVPSTPAPIPEHQRPREKLGTTPPTPTPLFPPPKSVWTADPLSLLVNSSDHFSPPTPPMLLMPQMSPMPLSFPNTIDRPIAVSTEQPAPISELRRVSISAVPQLSSLAAEAVGSLAVSPAAHIGLDAFLRRDASTQKSESGGPQEARIEAAQAASPLAPPGRVRTAEMARTLELLEAAAAHLPNPMDNEKVREKLYRHPVAQPPHYPQTAPANSDSLDYFLRLSPETLCFNFYYMEGSKAQYLAAKALKAQSWRFHKKYLVWFQRHEDPTLITDEYEQGTYIYFDYEKWAQKKKESFMFEYQYLEDRDLQ